MARIKKLIKPIAHVICILLINYLISQSKKKQKIIKTELERFLPDMKHILLWNEIDGFDREGQRNFVDNKCEELNCYVTTNRSLFKDIRYFDLVMFNLQDISTGDVDLPKVRGKYQKYVFVANNSADNYPICNHVYDGFFNWTWTYRRDSTIQYRYFSVYNLYADDHDDKLPWNRIVLLDNTFYQDLNLKSKAAAIFLDNCKSKSGREVFIKKLQNELIKYNLSVDVYGECGTMQCKKRTMKPCYTKLRRYYYFYLALEDSLSEDYVTDTVLYAFNNKAVPIVYGKADYEKYLPPDSFINGYTLGPKRVAQVMHEAITDLNKYHQYFGWKNFYKIKEHTNIIDPCMLCSSLNIRSWLTQNVVQTDFVKWWNDKPCESNVNYLL